MNKDELDGYRKHMIEDCERTIEKIQSCDELQQFIAATAQMALLDKDSLIGLLSFSEGRATEIGTFLYLMLYKILPRNKFLAVVDPEQVERFISNTIEKGREIRDGEAGK